MHFRSGPGEPSEACVNFFDGEGSDSSEDSDSRANEDASKTDESQSAEQAPAKLPNPFLQSSSKLPAPHLKAGDTQTPSYAAGGPTSSVFVNPFEQAEQAKLGILEKHVRLTEAAPKKPASKQVCFKFRKGTCHLGAKCRFFHDRSNIVLGGTTDRTDSAASLETAEQDSGPGFGRGDKSFTFPTHGGRGGRGGGGGDGRFYHPAAQFSRGQPVDLRSLDEDNYMNAAKGRKRCGVTDALVPPKKAMTGLEDLRRKERPWTTKK